VAKDKEPREKKGGEKREGSPRPEGAAAAAPAKRPAGPKVPARVRDRYSKEIVPRLVKEREYPNVMAVPRLKKVVVNMGVGEATQNIKLLDAAIDELGRITGQKPAMRRSRKSIAAFKLREGMPIAATVTLRGDRMYEFVDRLFNVALPRVRDFRGVPTGAFDGRGNYTLGLKDQLIFPEIDYAKVDKLRGMNVTFVTSARTDEESRLLLQYLGMPFRQQEAR
jgi:large subunit ribosomal protein L5